MKFAVAKSCIACGYCEAVCPEVFSIKNGKAVAIEENVAPQDEERAEDAMKGCPASAISSL